LPSTADVVTNTLIPLEIVGDLATYENTPRSEQVSTAGRLTTCPNIEKVVDILHMPSGDARRNVPHLGEQTKYPATFVITAA
jgi:hypothetical protein